MKSVSSSHLTRNVFRALLSSRPYRPANCLKRPRCLNASPRPYITPYAQSRTLFSFITGATPRTNLDTARATPKNLELATSKLGDLVRARRAQTRAPEHRDIISALNFLFTARLTAKTVLTRNEVYIATEACNYLLERDLVLGEDATSLTEDQLETIFLCLATPSKIEHFRADIRALATLLYTRIVDKSDQVATQLLVQHAIILARSGSASEARDLILRTEPLSPQQTSQALVETAKGFLVEGKTADFWNVVDALRDSAGQLDASTHSQLTIPLATADKMWDAEKMYRSVIAGHAVPSVDSTRHMLELYIRIGKMNKADALAQDLRDHLSHPGVLESLMLWQSMRITDPEELTSNIHLLLESAHGRASIDHFNAVIAYAFQHNNPALAAHMAELAGNEGFRPNGTTFALQLQYALYIDRLDRATQLYEAMLLHEIPQDNSDIPVLNKYIAKLAFAPQDEYSLMMRLVDNILERNADLDTEAVAGMCHVLLRRDDLDELTSILYHRIDFYPTADRARISAIFQQYMLDTTIPDQRVANIYELFRHAFPETPAATRLTIMQTFFDRSRPDLAATVFTHMRQCDPTDPGRPNLHAYQKCFEGIASTRDIDGLNAVYNMLKLDLQVELSTKIRNSLMLAYIACQTPWQAIIDHFYKIMDSREGPTYSTFEVALRACETWPPYGAFEARKIIAVMQSWNLEITKSCYDCYVGVMAGQCEFENTVELIDRMEEDIGEAPDAITIGTFYNAIPWQYRKDAVEQWAKSAYPELWQELLTYGDEIDEEFEVRYFKIDRSIDIDDDLLFGQEQWKPEIVRKTQAQIEPLPLKT